ncbi:CLUMA_CG011544, isoform A [Clunio marinus]|uniref:CLUMA_CG011544, isoform A n=1 Tax=Clunio marinus TaxID=568069 RepID=A0A1J1ID87_9DIPT|nr:CLUMA_CG011544, isoform A [Clunio marinus]
MQAQSENEMIKQHFEQLQESKKRVDQKFRSSDQFPSSPLSSYIPECATSFSQSIHSTMFFGVLMSLIRKSCALVSIIASKVADNGKAKFKFEDELIQHHKSYACFDTLASAQNSINTFFLNRQRRKVCRQLFLKY